MANTLLSLVMVQMWMDQFRKIPPTDISTYPIEAQVAWKRLLKSLRR